MTPTSTPTGDDTTVKTGYEDNTDNTDKSGTPTSAPTVSPTPTPSGDGTTVKTGYVDNTDNTNNDTPTPKNNNVVTPSSSVTITDLINKIQSGLGELRNALKIPSKVKRRHAREVVLGA